MIAIVEEPQKKQSHKEGEVDTDAPDRRSQRELLKAARERLERLQKQAGGMNLREASRSGKITPASYASEVAAIRAAIAEARRELNAAARAGAQEGVAVDVAHDHHHEQAHLEDEAYHLERMASYASVRHRQHYHRKHGGHAHGVTARQVGYLERDLERFLKKMDAPDAGDSFAEHIEREAEHADGHSLHS